MKTHRSFQTCPEEDLSATYHHRNFAEY